MDTTITAQVSQAVQDAAQHFGWFHVIGAFIAGLFTSPAAKKLSQDVTSQQVQAAAQDIKALAPLAETVATLAGQPALAGGIAATDKIIQAVSSTQDPQQLAALAIVHAQALASAAPATTSQP